MATVELHAWSTTAKTWKIKRRAHGEVNTLLLFAQPRDFDGWLRPDGWQSSGLTRRVKV